MIPVCHSMTSDITQPATLAPESYACFVLLHRQIFSYLKMHILLTNSMEQSPSWQANGHSPSQEIPSFMVHYRVHNSQSLSLCWATCVQITPSHYFPKIHSNIILPSTPRSSEWSLPFGFSDHNFVRIRLSCVLHVSPFLSSLVWSL